MKNITDFTGSVSVEGDVTPVTRQKIDQVTSLKWPEMAINSLWDQRITLTNRMTMAIQSGHIDIAKQIQRGINQLDAILQHKAAQAEAEAVADAKPSRGLI